MFTKPEQRSWIKIEVVGCRSTQECIRDCVKHVVKQRYHIAQWYDGLKRSRKAGMPFRTTFVHDYPTWRTTNFNSLLPCRMLIGSLSMSENCAPHSALNSGLQQIFIELHNPRHFQGATIAPLCSRTGLVGPVPKGR